MLRDTTGQRPRMSDAEFRMISGLLRAHCGLHFEEDCRYLLENRLGRRVEELRLRGFTAYHYLLRSGARAEEELAWVVDTVTTNETFFFRERSQLEALVHEIIPELRGRRGGAEGSTISVWSAGCASGEEPYSIVMQALEAGLVPGRDLRVYASDISRRMLEKARRGVYREASFRETEPVLRAKYFTENDHLWRISDDIKKHVTFVHLNLLDTPRLSLLGPMHVVLCRNVIIYFALDTRKRVIETFHEKLVPGGYLLLGHAESLINLSTEFELCHLRNDMVYEKPGRREASGRAGSLFAPEPLALRVERSS